jgi:hypothetical protein
MRQKVDMTNQYSGVTFEPQLYPTFLSDVYAEVCMFVCKGTMCNNCVENTRRHCSRCSRPCDQLPKICSSLHCSCLIQSE